MPENKYEPDEANEISAVTVRIFHVPSAPDGWTGTFEAHIRDIHQGRPGSILTAATMPSLTRQVMAALEERFDLDREAEVAKLGRDYAEADSWRAKAEKELARMREKFGVLPDEEEAR